MDDLGSASLGAQHGSLIPYCGGRVKWISSRAPRRLPRRLAVHRNNKAVLLSWCSHGLVCAERWDIPEFLPSTLAARLMFCIVFSTSSQADGDKAVSAFVSFRVVGGQKILNMQLVVDHPPPRLSCARVFVPRTQARRKNHTEGAPVQG